MNVPALPTIKRLCASSKNRCAFPGCCTPLAEKSGTFTGEICHIKAASELGPRYDRNQTEQDRHAYSNLILLCGRHHKVIDTELETYSVEALYKMKRQHEDTSFLEISPAVITLATALLERYVGGQSSSGSVKIVIASPGAIQADTVVIKTTKSRPRIAPNPESVAGSLDLRNYVYYLIQRYNEYQHGHSTKTDRYKYMAIYKAIEREFGARWELVPASRAPELIDFLKKRIDATLIGKKNKARSHSNYHAYDEHPHG